MSPIQLALVLIGLVAVGLIAVAKFSPAPAGSMPPPTRDRRPSKGDRQKKVVTPLRPILKTDLQRAYDSGPSFTDLLPWLEYLPSSQQILLADGQSRMACYELDPIPTEGRSLASIERAVEMLSQVLQDTFPEETTDQWVMQVFVNQETDLTDHLALTQAYADDHRHTALTQEFLTLYRQHVESVSSDSGYFLDEHVTESIWRGQMCRVRVVIYRRYTAARPRETTEYELEQVADRLESNLEGANIQFRRMDGGAFYYWMLFWLNPRPAIAEGDISRLHDVAPYPGDEALPLGRDLSELLCLSRPSFDQDKGIVWLDDLPHTVLQVQGMRRKPRPAHISGEDVKAGRDGTMADKFPQGTVVAYTLSVTAQDEIANRVSLVRDRAYGDTAESQTRRQDAEDVLTKMARGDKIYPLEIAIFMRGDDELDLAKKINRMRSQLSQNGMQTTDIARDAIPIDNYIKNLPGVYTPEFDRKSRRKAAPYFLSHAAALAPVYGRSRGTGHPGILMWNRTAEPCTFDPLNYQDRKKNAHTLVFGPTGAGKSSLLVWMLTSMLAVHRPRIFIIEAGNSFGLFGDWLQQYDVSVNQVRLTMNSAVSIPPFAEAVQLVKVAEPHWHPVEEDEDGEDSARDLMGEMELIARIMITGGDPDEKLSRALRMGIRSAIMRAAKAVFATHGEDGITTPDDVADAFIAMSQEAEYRDYSRNFREMGDAMRIFTGGLNGQLFNQRRGQLWADTDVTIVDLAQAVAEGNEDTLTVAYVSLIQSINSLIEREQNASRHTIVLTDEGHVVMVNPLLAPYIVKITKMWRKLGAWYWLATQNVDDFPASTERMLNMMEWWVCLAMPRDEVEKIARFKDLTDEQKNMMIRCRKEPDKYVEGVVLSDSMQMQFRNVPPPIALTLAMTEKHEKAERQRLMQQHGLASEMKAAELMATHIQTDRLQAMQ